MNARDGLGYAFPALFPVPASMQTIVLAASTNVAKVANSFKAQTVAIGIRVRGTGTARVQLGDATVAAVNADLSITKDDGWVFLSLDGQSAAGDRVKATYVSAYADGAAVTLEIHEFN